MLNNVTNEFELYKPMMKWLEIYLQNKYKGFEIITVDAHSERLDRVLMRYNIKNDISIGIDIKIDVLGIVRQSETNYKLIFVEAKKTNLTLKDLGQLWAYCKLIDPEEAYLFTSLDFGILNKVLMIDKREDLLNFGEGKIIKKMKVAKWNIATNSPDYNSMIPKL